MTEPVGFPRQSEPTPPLVRLAPYRQVTLQLLRFGLAGAFVFGIYTGGTLLLSGPVGLPIVLAIAIRACRSRWPINFTMQRHFVFLDHDTFALGRRGPSSPATPRGVCNYALTTSSSSPSPTPWGSRRSSFS